jgi:putative MFS transporter
LVIELGYSWNFDVGSKWREIVIWTQLPGILLFMCAVLFGFVDSAHAHMAQGNVTEARAVLETMRQQNNCPHVSIDFDVASEAPNQRFNTVDLLKVMFSSKLVLTTLVLCFTTAVINFVGYGFGYSLPIMLPKLDLGIHPPITIMGGSAAEVVGYLIAINASAKMPRISQMIWFFSLTMMYCVIIAFGIGRIESNQGDLVGIICILVVCLTLQAVTAPGWLVVYTYSAEVFPTMCRSFSGGFVIGCGRFGSMLAPFVFEAMYQATQSYVYFFVLLCVLITLVMACVMMVLKETKGVPLETFLGEEQPLVKSGQKDRDLSTSTFLASSASKPSSPSSKPLGNQSKEAFSDF